MFVPFWALLHAQGDEGGVSEYAKWMDAKGAEEAGNEAATEDKTVVDKIKDIGVLLWPRGPNLLGVSPGTHLDICK